MIPDEIAASLALRARASRNEVCGYIGGRENGLERVWQARNAEASPALFSMTLAEQYRILEEIFDAGMLPTAIWHSHPAGTADLSSTDIDCARLHAQMAPTPLQWIVVAPLPEPVVASYSVAADGTVAELAIAYPQNR